MKLAARYQAFIDEYLVDLNATQAAIRAGYSPKTAEVQGCRLLRNVKVRAAIDEAMAKRSERTEITVDKVLENIANIVFADPNEIMELRRCCCRYCWGKNHRWQYTENEMANRLKAYELELAAALDSDKHMPEEFDEHGGTGFDERKPPNPDCPECFGEGVTKAYYKDTRNLSPGARALYAGVKITKDGLEVKLRSQDKMVELLGRHLGMFNDKLDLNVSGSYADALTAAMERQKKAQDAK